MPEDFLKRLRKANRERAEEWMKSAGVTLGDLPVGFHGNELAGEAGEACNVIKKIDRHAYGMPGAMDPGQLGTILALGEELADVIICVDLIADKMGIDLIKMTERKFNYTSHKHGFKTKL